MHRGANVRQLAVTINTDNRLVSKTSVTKELMLVVKALRVGPLVLKDIIINGFKGAFLSGKEVQNQDYIHSVIAFYETLQRTYGGAHHYATHAAGTLCIRFAGRTHSRCSTARTCSRTDRCTRWWGGCGPMLAVTSARAQTRRARMTSRA